MVGVSGVRGIVGKDFTEDVVTRYATAFGLWARERKPLVVVGRDARKSGPAFETAVVAGLASVGCDVVKVGLAPTPTIQLAVEHHRAGGGIAITASHNPIEWNALKFIGPDGVFVDSTDAARLQQLAVHGGAGREKAGNVRTDEGAVTRHLEGVLRLPGLSVAAIRGKKVKVALDAVRGAGGPIMRALLERLGCDVAGIHLETDGEFPRAPEPVPENLGELAGLVRRSGAELGLAVDPDGARLAIVDERGEPIGEDYTLAFAVRAVLGGKREAGNGKRVVVCNLSPRSCGPRWAKRTWRARSCDLRL